MPAVLQVLHFVFRRWCYRWLYCHAAIDQSQETLHHWNESHASLCLSCLTSLCSIGLGCPIVNEPAHKPRMTSSNRVKTPKAYKVCHIKLLSKDMKTRHDMARQCNKPDCTENVLEYHITGAVALARCLYSPGVRSKSWNMVQQHTRTIERGHKMNRESSLQCSVKGTVPPLRCL